MIKKFFIAFAIICATVMMPGTTAQAQSQTQTSEESFMDVFVKEFNKECPIKSDESTTLCGAQFQKDSNTLIFNLTVDNPELTVAIFRDIADDSEYKNELLSGFLTDNDDLKTTLVKQGCTVIFSFMFPKENNKKANFIFTPKEIRKF